MADESLIINPHSSASDTRDYIRVYGGNNYFLILDSGKLYGLGRNEYGQIGRKSVPYIFKPKLITTCVTAAAAGWHFSGYVTSDGKVNIVHAGDITVVTEVENITRIFAISNTFFAVDREDKVFRIEVNENFFSYPGKIKFNVTLMPDSMKDELSINQYHMCRPLDLGLDNADLSDYKKAVKGKLHSLAVALKYDGKVDFIEPFFGKLGCTFEFENIADVAVSQSEDFLFSTKSNELLYVNTGFSVPLKSVRESRYKDAMREKKLVAHVRKIVLP